MMDQEAVVVRVEGDRAYVAIGGTGAGCGRCQEAGGCQSSILGQLFRSKSRQFRVDNKIGVVPGEQVLLRVVGGATLRAALLTYALPVLFLLFGALAGTGIGETGAAGSDVATALGALVGLAFGVLSGLTLRKTRIGEIAEPILIRRSSPYCLYKEARR